MGYMFMGGRNSGKSLIMKEFIKNQQTNPGGKRIMNSLEKSLIALRGSFEYADQHNIHVDNKQSIQIINNALNEFKKPVVLTIPKFTDEQKEKLRKEWENWEGTASVISVVPYNTGKQIAEMIYNWVDEKRIHPDDFDSMFVPELIELLENDKGDVSK